MTLSDRSPGSHAPAEAKCEDLVYSTFQVSRWQERDSASRGKRGRRIRLISFLYLSFHNFSLPMPAGALPCLVPEPKGRSTSLLLIQVGRGCGSRVVTLPHVLKLQLGHVQWQSHSVNSSLFFLCLELAVIPPTL